MVKNYGGNKSKKQGRKFVNAPRDRKLRFAEEIEELYSVVTRMFGNGMCEVKCIDGETRLCIFRKKFKVNMKHFRNMEHYYRHSISLPRGQVSRSIHVSRPPLELVAKNFVTEFSGLLFA